MKIMKNILYYIVPLLAMLSCAEQVELGGAAEGKLGTTISVVLPKIPNAYPQTRAMAINPDMENLYLAVFDNNGYLMEYVKADIENQEAIENSTEYTYNVTLKPTDGATTIHFIGNSPTASLNFGSEEELLASLYTENGNEAYWQRVVLPNGIKSDEETVDSLTEVQLIRNFAWINVISTAANFKIDAYCVVNTRTRGSVAPYNTNKNQFVSFTNGKDYDQIEGNGEGEDGYNGFIPTGASINENIPDSITWFEVNDVSQDNYAYFIYERERSLSNPPYILVRGTYTYTDTNGESKTMKNRYYKVDLRDSDGNYFPIIRNFRYRIKLTSIGHSGYDSAEDAANGAGSGDVSSAIETQTYNNISNGDARLFVSYTDTTIVDYKREEGYKLRYKYIIFNTDGTERIENDSVTISCTGNALEGEYTCATSNISQGTWNGWREITYRTTVLPNAPQTKSQQFVFTGTDDNGYTLHRNVNITLRNKFDLELECDPTAITKELGKPFDLIIKVPGGLGKSMFPLDIQLEAEAQSMTPNLGDNLPTVTGPSIVPGKVKTTIGFIKQLSRAEYENFFEVNKDSNFAYMPVPCHFKSNKAESATVIYANNKFFNKTSTELGNYVPLKFSELELIPDNPWLAADSEVEFSFTMDSLPRQGYITLALDNLTKADDEERLDYIGVDAEGRICYSFYPESIQEALDAPLRFNVGTAGTTIAVTLSAYQFEDASVSKDAKTGSFTNLKLTPKNAMLVKETEVDFTFTMSDKPMSVIVTLGNLKPATGENRLKSIEGQSGVYRFTPGDNLTETLKLAVVNSYRAVNVQLSAENFNSPSASLNPKSGSFTSMELTPDNATLPAGSVVTLDFKMSDMPSGDVEVTLTNLEPEGTTRATFVNGVYTFTPESLTPSLRFKVVTAGRTVKAQLSADNFNNSSVELDPKFVILANTIDVGTAQKNNRTFTIYSSSNSSNSIGSFKTTNNNKTNPNNIELKLTQEQYQAVINNGWTIYIKYTSNNKTYTATANLQTLLNGGTVTLNNWR